jgi:hypothetical protein
LDIVPLAGHFILAEEDFGRLCTHADSA